MSVKNLWGDIPDADAIRTPATILREQASVLGQMMNNILRAEVRPNHAKMGSLTKGDPAAFRYDFDIVAFALDQYAYTLFNLSHGVEMYPLRIYGVISQPVRVCADEEEFVAVVETILSSQQTHRVIANLLTLSRATV